MLVMSLVLLLCIMVGFPCIFYFVGLVDLGVKADFFSKKKAISEGHGDTAVVLLKAGCETDKRDVDGNLAIDLAPDRKVRYEF